MICQKWAAIANETFSSARVDFVSWLVFFATRTPSSVKLQKAAAPADKSRVVPSTTTAVTLGMSIRDKSRRHHARYCGAMQMCTRNRTLHSVPPFPLLTVSFLAHNVPSFPAHELSSSRGVSDALRIRRASLSVRSVVNVCTSA